MQISRAVQVALLLAFGIMLGLSGQASAQSTGSIEIHKRVCPAGTTGNIFDECHDNAPEQPVSFSLNGGAEEFVDDQGDVTFTGLAAGTYEITEVEGIPLEFVTLTVYCSVQDNDPEAFAVVTDGPSFSVELQDGEAIVCDVYNIAEDLSGRTPTATPAPVVTPTPAIQLPNTGTGNDSGSGLLLPFTLVLLAMVTGMMSIAATRRAVARSGK